MGIFKDKSNLFKGIAIKNKKIAHTVEENGEERNSFHRMNDEEELISACVNFAHFPCMVHFGFYGRYTGDDKKLPKNKCINELLILKKVDHPSQVDQIEDAYDLTFEIMEEVISWIYNEWSTKGYCGPFANIDLSRFSFQQYSVNGNLFGWLLSFEDDRYIDGITNFDASKWYE